MMLLPFQPGYFVHRDFHGERAVNTRVVNPVLYSVCTMRGAGRRVAQKRGVRVSLPHGWLAKVWWPLAGS